jgi:nitrate reductase / nitrite oxidoreductase, beta subunit
VVTCSRAVTICVSFRDGRIANPSYHEVFCNVGVKIMARVHNWQIGRDMSYWYPESRPQRQFAAVFDINKCIACQTCTLACKTTWTSGKGQEYMLWNNVESKPYGFYPLAWDLNLLKMLGPQSWKDGQYEGRTIFEAAPAGQRVLGWRPEEQDYSYPNVGEDDCAGQIEHGAALNVPHLSWFFYLARICNHCTYPACLAACSEPRSTSGPRTASCSWTRAAVEATGIA